MLFNPCGILIKAPGQLDRMASGLDRNSVVTLTMWRQALAHIQHVKPPFFGDTNRAGLSTGQVKAFSRNPLDSVGSREAACM